MAFEAILAPLIDPAHRLASALLHDPDLAKDAVQEASVLAWRKMVAVDPVLSTACHELRAAGGRSDAKVAATRGAHEAA